MKFFGNIEVGKELSVPSLLEAYSAVLLASGAVADNTLQLRDSPAEEDLHSVHGLVSSRDFVSWYNGHPFARRREMSDLLRDTKVELC